MYTTIICWVQVRVRFNVHCLGIGNQGDETKFPQWGPATKYR